MDETFKSCPGIFEQVYSFYVMPYDGYMIPQPDKSHESYQLSFETIRDVCHANHLNIMMTSVTMDYEMATFDLFGDVQ
jgi:hypothetical protein